MIIEQKLNEIMTHKYGTDLFTRMQKLSEEYTETIEAFNEMKEKHCGNTHLKDEISDMLVVLSHIAFCLGTDIESLLLQGYTKIVIREHNPNYLKDEKK